MDVREIRRWDQALYAQRGRQFVEIIQGRDGNPFHDG